MEIGWPPGGTNYGILVGTGAGEYSQFENASGYYTQLANSSWGVLTNGNIDTSGRVYDLGGYPMYNFGGSWQPGGYTNPFTGTYGCPSGYTSYIAFGYSSSQLDLCYK